MFLVWIKYAKSSNNVDNRKERIKRNNVCSNNRMEQQIALNKKRYRFCFKMHMKQT